MIKIGCHSLTWANYYKWKKYNIKKALNDIKKIGYDGVELVEPLSFFEEPETLKKTLHDTGLELISLSCSLDEEFKKRIDFLSQFNASVAMLYTGWVAKGRRKEGFLIHSLRHDLESMANYARKQHIDVALHPHKETLVETKPDLEDFYSEPTDIKLCVDIAHLAACDTDPLEILKEFRKKIVYVHLKDYDHKKKRFTELGRGDLDLGPILSYLKDNYNGWLTVELDFTSTTPVKSARINREYLKKSGF